MVKEKSKNIAIIGSGVAGLACAVRLASKGHQVSVFEKSNELGGKMGQLESKGYRFDTGPSLFTQPALVDDIIQLVHPDEKFDYKQVQISCKYFWEDHTVFRAYEDKRLLKKELKKIFPAEANSFLERLKRAEELYELTGDVFIEKPLNKTSTWLSKKVVKALFHLRKFNLNKSMHEVNASDFNNEKLQQLFDRFATYNGSNPYAAPAILNMIPHLELNLGTFYPKGGLRSVPLKLIELGERLGVDYHLNEKVEKIKVENDHVVGLNTKIKEYSFDSIVSNADVYPTYKYLLKDLPAPKKVLEQERSSSGVIFYWGVKKTFPALDLHNIFFSDSYEEEFDAIFNKGVIINDPTIYLNISSKIESEDAPEGCENWFILVNAPANQNQDWSKMIKEVRINVVKKLSRILKVDIGELIETEEVLDPVLIEKKTSSYQGSLYGTSSNNKYAAFMRHTNDHAKIKNLFFCGGSVHPGGGIPLCLNSAKIVSELI